MTKALASLIGEHQLVSRVVEALEVYAHRLRHGDPIDTGDLARFARVFKEFADQIHHEKEERILLPLLFRHGLEWSSGVLPVVRLEHRQESSFIDVLCRAAQLPPPWTKNERRQIAAAALALGNFQREHHRMENAELFPAVALQLSEHVLGQLQAALEAFDAETHRRALRAVLVMLAHELIERYTPRADAAELKGAPRGA